MKTAEKVILWACIAIVGLLVFASVSSAADDKLSDITEGAGTGLEMTGILTGMGILALFTL